MLIPTVRILLVLICVRANLDTAEMAKHAKVRIFTGGPYKQCVCLCSKYEEMYGNIEDS